MMTRMMFCPTCDEIIPAEPRSHDDSICLTCGDRLISQPDDTVEQSQEQPQPQPHGIDDIDPWRRQRQPRGGSGDDAEMAAMDAAISAILASELSAVDNIMDTSISAFDNPMAAAAAATNALPTTATTHHRPASQKALDNLKREVLTAKSAELLETQVELFESCRIDEIPSSSSSRQRLTLDAIPGEFSIHHDNHHRATTATTATATTYANKALSDVTPPHHHNHPTTAALVLCTPRTTRGGQLSTQTHSEIAFLRKHGIPFIAYVTRGDNVTFVQKALVCQRAGMVSTDSSSQQQQQHKQQSNPNLSSSLTSSSTTSRCIGVIVGNATSTGNGHEVWPYIMQDPKKEAQQFGLEVPVVMIRRDDGRRLVQWATTTTTNVTSSTAVSSLNSKKLLNDKHDDYDDEINNNYTSYFYTPCRIIIRNKDSDESNSCPVCADSFAIGNIIVRLPNCGHVFHEACALAWLTRHNTCPYCRSEMPTEDEEYERERRRRQRSAGVNDRNGHDNFYG